VPVWNINKRGGLTLTYVKNGTAKAFGAPPPLTLLSDLFAWVCDAAQPADRIVVEGEGVFVRMASPPMTFGGE
jgi:hypothetical protein